MPALTEWETLYAATALLFQALLVAHFALRRWRFQLVLHYGWIFYALSLPAAAVSVALFAAGAPWYLWIGGGLFVVWAAFGGWVEYVRRLEWRTPIRWSIFIPYIALYLATAMFYWWPLARVWQPLWYLAAALFVLANVLNAASHQGPRPLAR